MLLRFQFIMVLIWLLSPSLTVSQITKPANSTIVPFFQNGAAQKVRGFGDRKEWIKHELWVETDFDSDKDGKLDRMHVMVTRQVQTDTDSLKLPVIYMSSPYFGGLAKSRKRYQWNPRTELGTVPKMHKHASVRQKRRRNLTMFTYDLQWVPRGYVMVYSSSPGTGLSDGAPSVGGENETLAPKAVIDWLCGRAKGFVERNGSEEVVAFWSSQKIGMIGASYNGTLALAAATTGVKGLEAIIPLAPVTSWYHYYRSNGLVRPPGGYAGEDMDVLFDMIHTADRFKRKHNARLVRDSVLLPQQDRLTGDYNTFWEKRNYIDKMANMTAAMFIVHSFNDWNVMLDHSIMAYHQAKKENIPVKLYVGQGPHGASPPFELMNLWFTKYLHGINNGAEKSIEVLLERPGYSGAVGYSSFPDTAAEMVPFYFAKSGFETGQLILDHTEKQGIEKLIDNYKLTPQKLALSKHSINRLLYETPVLNNELRLSGSVEVNLKLKASVPAANLSVYLVALTHTDYGTTSYELITRGWADPQNHLSLWYSDPLDSNVFVNMSFKLVTDDQIIEPGQSMAVMVFSSDNEFTLHPEPGAELTIDLDETSILLPIVGGKLAYQKSLQ